MDARLPCACRRDQSRRLDRTGQGSSGAASDRAQTGSAHDRLQRGKIRLNRAEYARLDFLDSAEGQAICVGLARESGDRQARIADERLALKPMTDGLYQTTEDRKSTRLNSSHG